MIHGVLLLKSKKDGVSDMLLKFDQASWISVTLIKLSTTQSKLIWFSVKVSLNVRSF